MFEISKTLRNFASKAELWGFTYLQTENVIV